MSRTVEEKIVATLINGTNSTVKAKRDITLIGQVINKIEKIERMQNNGAIWFGIKEPVKSFTGREKELNELHELVKVKRELTVISQMATVSGAGGIGKSELARKYAYIHRKDFDNNIAWMNSETQESLRKSFIMLAKDLKIPITEERVGKEGDRDIKFIVKDVYKYFTNVSSLFIFDNAEKYKDIIEFLPSSFSLSPDDKKHYVLITSRNQYWEVREEGKIEVIKLNEFTPEEAVKFIKNTLNIKNDLQNEHIEKLARELQYFPLALRQAVTYIEETNKKRDRRGHKKFEISDYLKKYEKDTQELLEFSHENDRYAKTTFVTWKITLENIMQIGHQGKVAIEILEIMAYLAPDNIPIEGFFSKLAFDEQIIGEEMSWSAVELLNQYSMINIVKGMSDIHRLVQQVIRIELQNQSKEEEILEKALKLINSSDRVKYSASHIASVWNYASKYGKLIDEFYFNSSYDYDKKTPLHILAKNGYSKAIEAILIHIGKNELNEMRRLIYTPNKYHYTPFATAIKNGYLDVIKVFLEKGADTKTDEYGNTSMHWAAGNGHLDVVKYLVEEKGADVKAADNGGNTPLHRAAYNGNLDVVKYLVKEKGADIKAANNGGDTPLHQAARYGNWDVVKYLIEEKGADIKAANNDGDTPLHQAARYGNVDVVKYLVEEKGADAKATNNAGDTPLHMTAIYGNWDVVKYLIEEKGADAKAADKHGNTPLHWAAANGKLDSVKYFVEEKGASVKAADKHCITPLHRAAGNGHLDVVKYLVEEKGADAKAVKNDGDSPLRWATENGHLDVVKYLVEEKDADIKAAKNNGDTPLHWAVRHGKWDVVKYLVEEKGADVKAANNDGDTPLHRAARYGHLDVVKYLVEEKGADVKAANNAGNTPLHRAARYGHLGVVKYLVGEKGADFKAVNNDGDTPLHWAAENGKLDVVKYLVEKKGANINEELFV